MGWRDRLQTIVVTAALTSAAWIVASTYFVWVGPSGPSHRQPLAEPQQVAIVASAPAPQKISQVDFRPLVSIPAQSLDIPVLGVRSEQLTDTFEQARAGGARRHDAIDIMAPRGTPVLAAAPGRVEKLFLSHEGGNTIYVRSPDSRIIYYYAHLDSYAPGLAAGHAVTARQVIGTVGSSGNANPTAPHLHFAVLLTTPEAGWWQGEPINPYPLLVRR